MSDYVKRKLRNLNADDEVVTRWAVENGYGNLLPGNIALVRQIYIDANDDEELQFPDLEMKGTRVTVKDIPQEEWVIIRVFMFKIARVNKYNMCPEDGCYARVSDSTCKARDEKSHGYVTESVGGIRHYYLAGDGGVDGERVYVIVPAKYAMNDFNFENQWCDVKGIWNIQLDGFYANLILPIGEEELKDEGIDIPVPLSKKKAPSEVGLPKDLDLTAFSGKPNEVTHDNGDARYQAELRSFAWIIPFFSGYELSQFDEFISSHDIVTPIEKLIEGTPGCRLENGRVIYAKPLKNGEAFASLRRPKE